MNKAFKKVKSKSREELLKEVQQKVTFNYLKDLGICRYLINLMLVCSPIMYIYEFRGVGVGFEGYIIIASCTAFFVFMLIMFNKNADFVLTVGNGKIEVAGRVVDIKGIQYMGIIGIGIGGETSI